MPSAPQTWTLLTAARSQVQAEVLVGGVSPFTALSAADAAKYGVTNAIYIGEPKEINTYYTAQCHLIPLRDKVSRYAHSGRIYDELTVYVRFAFNNTNDDWTTLQALTSARDAAVPMFERHAQLPGAPIVNAAKLVPGGPGPEGMHYDEAWGRDWTCWGFNWWFRQEYQLSGGIVS